MKEKSKKSWNFFHLWQHSDVDLNSKSGLPPSSFLWQATYGFEAYEVMNPMVQADYNSKLKRGRYDLMKQDCAKCMAAQ